MRATRRVSAMRVRQKRIAKKKTSIRIVDISDLPEGAMLKVKTQFSTYLIVVVDPTLKEVAVSNNSTTAPNGPDMFTLEESMASPVFPRVLEAGRIMVGARMALVFKKPMPPGEQYVDTSVVERISLVANLVRAKLIVDKAMVALDN